MLKNRFLKQTNLIKTALKSMFEQIIIDKIIFDRLNSINKKCKLVNHKKNI